MINEIDKSLIELKMEAKEMIQVPSAILDKTKEEIERGVHGQDADTVYEALEGVFSTLLLKFHRIYSNRILSIIVDTQEMIDTFKTYRLPLQAQKLEMLVEWVNHFAASNSNSSDVEFGKLKIDLEFLFLEFGGKQISFEYKEAYLLTPKEAEKELNISNVTFSKYVGNGLEIADTTHHKKVPKFVVELWNDPSYCFKMQMIYQKKKSNNSGSGRTINRNK
jgi:hypothetical protein